MGDKKDILSPFNDLGYSSDFIEALGKEFGFNGKCPEEIAEINYIRNGYFSAKAADRIELSKKPLRADYAKLQRGIEEFRVLIESLESLDLSFDMYLGARMLGEPKSQTDFPEITAFKKTSGKPYCLELLHLLRILEKGTDIAIERFSPPRGRPNNYAIEAVVRRSADFWEDKLDGKFTHNPYEGAGLTRSFLFVQRI
ncbi:MAG: hypothetical protein COA84_12740, partial [Robiginitomaculum sp.]